MRAEMNIVPATLTPLVLAGASAETQARAQRWSDVVKRLARLGDISFADVAPQGAVQLLIRGEVAALPLKGVIDLGAEKTRLEKELGESRSRHQARRRQALQREIRRQRRGRDRRGRAREARGSRGAQGQDAGSARAAQERGVSSIRESWMTVSAERRTLYPAYRSTFANGLLR